MDIWVFNTVAVLVTCGALTAITYIIFNSPGVKSRAEVRKLERLKELQLLEDYRRSDQMDERVERLEALLNEQDKLLSQLSEENKFIRRLLEDN
jgi:hypothetical protein